MTSLTADAFQQEIARAMSEQELQERVQELLTLYGWCWTHFRPARSAKGWRTALSGAPGFFDIVAVDKGVDDEVGDGVRAQGPLLLFIELKSELGRERAEQKHWRRLMSCVAGLIPGDLVGVYLWRPTQLLDGTIARVLK